jgi:hypothetical protein
MVSISLTEIDERSNPFFLLGVSALSLFYEFEKVGGRFFLFGGHPLSDHGVPQWKNRDPEEEQPNRLHHLPTEDIALLERVAHTGNASAIRAVNTTDFTQRAPTTGRVGLTFNGAAHPYVQLASELFSDFPSVRAEKPVPVTGSKLFLLPLNVINVISGAQFTALCTSESSDPNLYSGNQKF